MFTETLFSLYTRLSDVTLTFYMAALFLRLLKTLVGWSLGEQQQQLMFVNCLYCRESKNKLISSPWIYPVGEQLRLTWKSQHGEAGKFWSNQSFMWAELKIVDFSHLKILIFSFFIASLCVKFSYMHHSSVRFHSNCIMLISHCGNTYIKPYLDYYLQCECILSALCYFLFHLILL